jgi:hypothetical protein
VSVAVVDVPDIVEFVEALVAVEAVVAEIMEKPLYYLLTHLQGFKQQCLGRIHDLDVVLVRARR